MGVDLVEVEASAPQNRCCGLGGQIKSVDPHLVSTIARRRVDDFSAPVVTYCSRCRASLRRTGAPTIHIAELLVGSDADEALQRPPFGTLRRYVNRLLTKRDFRKMRERGMGHS
jgi:hypothetical protein